MLIKIQYFSLILTTKNYHQFKPKTFLPNKVKKQNMKNVAEKKPIEQNAKM